MVEEMKIKLSQLNVILGIIGSLFLAAFLFKQAIFLPFLGVMLLPGFLLSYYFSEREFSFLERFSLGLALSNAFLIILRALTTLSIHFNKVILYSVVLVVPLIIGLVKYKSVVRDFKKSFGSGKTDHPSIFYNIFVISAAVFLIWFVWGPLLQGSKLPLTDQVVQQAFINTYKSTIENYGRYPYWVSEYSGGFPLVLFDSPFYYERVAIDWMMMDNGATFQINYYSFLNLVLLLIGIYCLTRRLGWSRLAAIFSMVFFIISPVISSKLGYSGDMKEMTSFAILPMLLVAYLLALEKKERGYYVLMGALAATYYFTNLVPLVASAVMILFFFAVYKIANKEGIKKRELLGFGLAGITLLCLIGLNLVPMALSMKYGTPESWTYDYGRDVKTFYESLIRQMFSEPIIKPFNQYSHNMGIFFTITALAGMGLSLKNFKKNENFLLISFWLMLLSYFVPFLKTVMSHVESQRLVLLRRK